MPRATQNKATQIVTYFQTAALEVAELVFAMVKDTMRERKMEAANLPSLPKPRRRRRARKAAQASAPVASPTVTKVAKPKRARRTRKTRTEVEPDLPTMNEFEGIDEPEPATV